MANTSEIPNWAILRVATIMDAKDPSQVYLKRFILVKTPYFSVYVHRILLPDTDRNPHDHPFEFSSLILRGGYIEDVYRRKIPRGRGRWVKQTYVRNLFSYHRHPLSSAHSITTVLPNTTTLVLAGRRVDTWGFWDEKQGFIDWKDYTDSKGN